MINDYRMRGHVVQPRSIVDIRQCAKEIREIFEFPDGPIDLGYFLEHLFLYGVTVDVIDEWDESSFLNHTEACCIPETATIYLSEYTYKQACHNHPRTRYTIMHELGHLVLGHSRTFHRGLSLQQAKPFIDSEWQADQFAAEILMPLDIIRRDGLFSPGRIQDRFGVSSQASEIRYRQLVKRGDINN